MEPVVVDGIEGSKGLACPPSTLLEILVKHLFPASCVDAGRVRYPPVEVEQDGVVPVAGDQTSAAGLSHRSLSSYQGTLLCYAGNHLECLVRRSLPSATHLALVDERPVPNLHGGHLPVVTEDTKGTGIEQEMLTGARGQPDPAGCQHAQYMPMGEQRDVPVDCARTAYHAVNAGSHLFRCFATRASIPEHEPT